jgi:FMN phosphatase YigB (HAD superfamily)
MIRVVMFDLGLTLLDANDQPFPHVKEALTKIAGFKTGDGKKLRSCLVSDFPAPDPPVTPAKIKARFAEYLAILDGAGIRANFEPTAKRVTLSIHAGVFKPDRKVFEKALQRLGVTATLKECLFITENAGHVRVARQTLQMKALQFRSSGASQFDFDNWAKAPTLIASLLAA